MKIDAPISAGELVDKITILEIKLERLRDATQLANVRAEHDLLTGIYVSHKLAGRFDAADAETLRSVNRALWDVEDLLREHEARGEFNPAFVELARSVYRLNDRRAAAKKSINLRSGSLVVEEKSYKG